MTDATTTADAFILDIPASRLHQVEQLVARYREALERATENAHNDWRVREIVAGALEKE